MSGMEPILIGAALGGGISAAKGNNPIKGALLGGIGGGALGAAFPQLGLKGGIGNFINGIGTNALAGGDVGKGLAINAAALAASGGGGFTGGGYGSMGTSGFTASAPQAAASGGFMDTLGGAIGRVGGFAKENPMLTQMAFQTANQMMEPGQIQMPGASPIVHGQVAQGDTSLLSLLPQQQRQPISLI